jgi:hypothetical protein
MTPLAGDHVQVLVGGFELTGDLNRIQISDERQMYDISTFSDAVHKFLPGRRKSSVQHNGWMNRNAARSHPVLRGSEVSGVVSVVLGNNTTPAAGDLSFSLSVVQGKYSVMPEVAKAIPFNASFASNSGGRGGWGVALCAPVTITNSTTGTAQDNGASSGNGGAAFLHITQNTSADTYAIVVEGSTTGAFAGEQTTVATFSANGTTITSERLAITGTVPRYLRYRATRTGSAGNPLRLAVMFVRF